MTEVDNQPPAPSAELVPVQIGRTSGTGCVTLHVSDPFPDIELVDHEGRPWRTAEMRRRPLVLILHRHLA